MKIYNKKKLVESLLFCILGLTLLVTCFIKGVRLKSVLLSILCLLFGTTGLIRSTSEAYAKQDLLEERDERNQLINLKSKCKAFILTQRISFIIGLLFTIVGTFKNETSLTGFGTGFIMAYTLGFFTELFTFIYFDKNE